MNSYVCEEAVGTQKICSFRCGKIILKQPIDAQQMSKLLTTGKTDLLKEFISVRTQRRFSAFLKLDREGRVSFEFENRSACKAVVTKSAKKINNVNGNRST